MHRTRLANGSSANVSAQRSAEVALQINGSHASRFARAVQTQLLCRMQPVCNCESEHATRQHTLRSPGRVSHAVTVSTDQVSVPISVATPRLHLLQRDVAACTV